MLWKWGRRLDLVVRQTWFKSQICRSTGHFFFFFNPCLSKSLNLAHRFPHLQILKELAEVKEIMHVRARIIM